MKPQMNSSFSDELACITHATDEEQDDLPYDRNRGISYKYNNNADDLSDCTSTNAIPGILNLVCSEDNKTIKATANYEIHPQLEEISSHHRDAIGTTESSAATLGNEAAFKKELLVGSSSIPGNKDHLTYSKISHVLLRHFSKEELTHTCQLIECETIPETSFTESIDDIVTKPEPSEHVKGHSACEHCATNFEESSLEKHKEVNTGDKNQNSVNEDRCVSKKPVSSAAKGECRRENSQLITKNEDTHTFQHMEVERAPFKKRVSFHELKYGQGQAHCSLLNFSKVASDVKVPKPSGSINSVPTTERPKPFPILPSKSLIVNDITENKNYLNSAEVENQEEMSIPELLQQLEKLPQSDFPDASTAIYSGGTETASEAFTLHNHIPIQSTHGLSKARLQCGPATAIPAASTAEAHCPNLSDLLPQLTLGEKMSQVLKDQTDQLIKKVENYSQNVTQDTFLLQDNYLVLNQLKRYLDALERNYLTAKEHHHHLQLQNYKDKSVNIGEFDPERKVEGEIFRLGMLLEDLQEQTDDSNCNLSSLPDSYESPHSSYSPCESSLVSSTADLPEGRGIETVFLHNNNAGEKHTTADVISETNQFSSERDKCNVCLHLLQKSAELTCRRDTEPLGKGGLLANKYSYNIMRFLSPEEKYAAGGLASQSQGAQSEKLNADEESMKGNVNIQERKTGTCSLFIQRKPTDLSDTNLISTHYCLAQHKMLRIKSSLKRTPSQIQYRILVTDQEAIDKLPQFPLGSDSEDISACDSYSDSQSKKLVNCKTESYISFNTRLTAKRKEFRCRCSTGSRDEFKLRNYKKSVESCALCRSYGSSSYSQKGISIQRAQKNRTSCELLNRLSERQNSEAAKTCYSSPHDKIIPSHRYLPTKKSAQSRSAINIRNRNANDSQANILSFALDHAIQTAKSLKKATEQMVRTVSEDLAKVKRKQL